MLIDIIPPYLPTFTLPPRVKTGTSLRHESQSADPTRLSTTAFAMSYARGASERAAAAAAVPNGESLRGSSASAANGAPNRRSVSLLRPRPRRKGGRSDGMRGRGRTGKQQLLLLQPPIVPFEKKCTHVGNFVPSMGFVKPRRPNQ